MEQNNMVKKVPRRSLVGAIGFLFLPGCLDSSPDDNRSRTTDDGDVKSNGSISGKSDDKAKTPDRCEVNPQTGWGRGDAVVSTISSDSDNIVDKCTSEAADVALAKTLDRADVNLHESPPQWIQSYVREHNGENIIEISVRVEYQSEATGNGSAVVCPPENYSFEDLIETVPQSVKVESGEVTSEKSHMCNLRVRLKQSRQQLD